MGPAHWEASATYWHLVENSGFERTLLAEAKPWISSPVLVLGAGQGLLVQALIESGFPATEGVDFAPSMVRLARERRGLKLVCADASNVPADTGSYGTVVVATGVLRGGPEDDAVLREARRLLKPSGILIVGVYAPRRDEVMALEELGLMQDNTLSQSRLIELWEAQNKAVDLVYGWTGKTEISMEGAHLLTLLIDRVERFAACLRAAGEEPTAILRQSHRWSMQGWDGPMLEECLLGHHVSILHASLQADTLMAVSRVEAIPG